jgi:putative tryptophan/tyrosine transport system permease protein
MTLWIGALALGLAFATMALGVYVTFRVLAFPDLTVDGSLPLGAAVSAVLIVNAGWHPWATLPVAMVAGALAGTATALLNTRFNINGLLAGILVSLGLWTVNLRVMGDRSNLPLLGTDTVLTPFRPAAAGAAQALGVNPSDVAALGIYLVLTLGLAAALNWLLHTELGLALRATGDNERTVLAMGVNPSTMKLLGLALANALVGLSGSLVSQYQGFSDVGIGLGMIVAGLASVIIGETLVRPGGVFSTILSVALGSVFYRLVIAAALFIGLGPTDMRLVTSLIVVVALGLPQVRGQLRVRAWAPA